MQPLSASTILSPEEALGAIYIDFEGRKGRSPVLLGACYAEGRYRPNPDRVVLRQDIVDCEFAGLAEGPPWEWPGRIYRYDGAARSLASTMADLVGRARAQDRLIVSWSQHDFRVLQAAGLPEWIVGELAVRYRDGKATARRWRNKMLPGVALPAAPGRCDGEALARYFALVGFEVPDEYGPGRVGRNLERIGRGLRRGGVRGLSAGVQQAWQEVLGHNLYDCVGLRHVVGIAAGGLAGATNDLTLA